MHPSPSTDDSPHPIAIDHIAEVLSPLVGEPPDRVIKVLQSLDMEGNGTLTLEQCEKVVKTYPHLPDIMPQWQKALLHQKGPTTRNLSVVESLLAGGCAGAVSKSVIAPGDRVKILYQVSSERIFTLQGALRTGRDIVREEGVLALWKGNGAMMIRVIPYSSITYMTFERYHHSISTYSGMSDAVSRFISGSCAGATAVTLTYPLDLMRARLAAQQGKNPMYESYYTAFYHTATTEGLKGLYHGLTPTLLGIIPYAGTSFCVYGSVKSALATFNGVASEKDLPKWQLLVGGGFSGLMAQSATYPLDIIRRRMQVRSSEYRSLLDCAQQIWIHEGYRAFYKGLSMNYIKGPLATGVSFMVNDSMKIRIRGYHIEEAKSISAAKQAGHEPRLTLLESMLSGGFAGAAAKLITSPLERVKTLYQVNPHRNLTLKSAMKSAGKIVGASGLIGLWRGSGITLLRVVPYAALTYSTYDVMKYHTPRFMFTQEPDAATRFVAGAVAGVVATTVTYPFDVLRVRMAGHWGPTPLYASAYAGLCKTIEREGARSLMVGLRPALFGIAPFVGINFSIYDTIKPLMFGPDPAFYQRMALGGASALAAQAVTYPFYIVSRRIQMSDMLTHGGPIYSNEWEALRTIYRTDGFLRGFYSGMRVTWMIGPIAVGLSFSINDIVRNFFVDYKDRVHEDYQQILKTLGYRSGQ